MKDFFIDPWLVIIIMASAARKERAKTQKMKITYYSDEGDSYQVGVLGSRKLPYILKFSPTSITCSCPDYQIKKHKPICKHIYFIIHLAKNNLIFNTVDQLIDLIDVDKVAQIRENLMQVIDKKKMDSMNSVQNTISIERDDYCSICTMELDGQIEKCHECEHVLHINCLEGWWNDTSYGRNIKRCPYCRCDTGFSHIFEAPDDPWERFDFRKLTEELQSAETTAESPVEN